MEARYHTILQNVGLSQFFSPFEKAVTLSTHVGVKKPDWSRVSGGVGSAWTGALPLDRCLLITEEAEHVAKVRSYGMKALGFGAVGVLGVDLSA